MKPQPVSTTSRTLSILAAAIVVLALLMGVGPGVLLVNRPSMFLGLPLVYSWGIGWYFVMCAVAIVSYRWIWRGEMADETTDEDDFV
ncbi:hypothetical protein EC9_52290 [Rosistilla ulvae]|uniref:DUF3311 domain-containing protein n=1 Tax=Rosistilla ulvae TaxID=1930277 RepID=A0A517M809_9BACT|nr:hypothetical protein [Rosistilla ulvae]QDS91010.1 hypothetical protein EC9_52290 [Rosistilla ulvae]